MNEISSPDLHPELGNYMHAVRAEAPMVFISGQVPLTPAGELVSESEVDVQAHQVFENLVAALARKGCRPTDLVRLTTYLVDPGSARRVASVRDAYLSGHRCSSTVVGVSALLDPHWLVEVDAIASLPGVRP